jgi:hypothetical protein
MTDQTTTVDATTGEVKQTRPFADVLRDLDGGRVHTELSDALQKLVKAVEDTGKKGTVQFSITVGPSKTEAPFEAIPAVVVKLPMPARRASVFYADDDGNLVRRDPRQQEIPGVLRDVNADKPAPIREAR